MYKNDQTIIPNTSLIDDKAQNIKIDAYGHNSILFKKELVELIDEHLNNLFRIAQ